MNANTQGLERAEEARRPLEARDEIQFAWRHGARGLRVIGDRAERLRLQRRLPSVQHQHRIERRRIQRRRNARAGP